jgi:hypothetical protein
MQIFFVEIFVEAWYIPSVVFVRTGFRSGTGSQGTMQTRRSARLMNSANRDSKAINESVIYWDGKIGKMKRGGL